MGLLLISFGFSGQLLSLWIPFGQFLRCLVYQTGAQEERV